MEKEFAEQHGLKWHPLSHAELEMADGCKQEQDGLRIYTRIGGYAGSSTRTELAAAIIAISAYGPVHLASDSKAFVDLANQILDDLKHSRPLKRSWKLTNDGDLWHHFHEAAREKVHTSLQIVWTKGHATDDQVEQGVTTTEQQRGNTRADETADLGTAVHDADLVKLSKMFHGRYKRYKSFMKDISKHIIEAYTIHRQLMDRYHRKAAHDSKHMCNTVAYEHLH